MTTYDSDQPIPVGFKKATRPADVSQSWVFKRNFTFSVTDDGAPASAWWDATSLAPTDDGVKLVGAGIDYNSIICAVNIWGQDDYYQYPVNSFGETYNAYCYRDDRGTCKSILLHAAV